MENKNFCIRPFNSVYVDTDGSVSTCCKIYRSNIKFKGKHDYNLKTDSIQDFWNSDFRKKLMESFLKGEHPSECKKCWDDEKKGLKSLRQFTNTQYGIIGNKDPKDYLTILKKLDLTNPEDYNLNITNLCNLKCYMCRGQQSSRLLVENADLGIDQLNQKDYEVDDQRLDYFITQIIENNVTHLALQGGEPLLSPKILELLHKLSTQPNARKMSVLITTNATIYNKKIFDMLVKFGSVKIVFSIDGVDKVNDYLRFPSKFDDIKSNVESFKKLPNATFMITCVVQNINLLCIKEMIEFAHEMSIHLTLSTLEGPAYLYLGVLPEPTKKKALEKLQRVDPKHLQHVTDFDSVKSLIQSALAKDEKEKLQMFKSIINARDNYRKIKMSDFVRELASDIEQMNLKEISTHSNNAEIQRVSRRNT